MNGAVRGVVASSVVAAVLWVSGCKSEPSPPTEQDAIAVAKNINRCRPIGNDAELISLKKTNGQMETINGSKVYTLYYTATKRNLIQVGIHPPGWTETWSSNYPFQWTEKGWQGPDGQVYPKH
jgi:hypothetical protein